MEVTFIALLCFGHKIIVSEVGTGVLPQTLSERMQHDITFGLGRIHEGLTFYHSMLNNSMDRFKFPLFCYWFDPAKVTKCYSYRYIYFDCRYPYRLPSCQQSLKYIMEDDPRIIEDINCTPLVKLALSENHSCRIYFNPGLSLSVDLCAVLRVVQKLGIHQYIVQYNNGMPIYFFVDGRFYGLGFSVFFYFYHRFW